MSTKYTFNAITGNLDKVGVNKDLQAVLEAGSVASVPKSIDITSVFNDYSSRFLMTGRYNINRVDDNLTGFYAQDFLRADAKYRQLAVSDGSSTNTKINTPLGSTEEVDAYGSNRFGLYYGEDGLNMYAFRPSIGGVAVHDFYMNLGEGIWSFNNGVGVASLSLGQTVTGLVGFNNALEFRAEYSLLNYTEGNNDGRVVLEDKSTLIGVEDTLSGQFNSIDLNYNNANTLLRGNYHLVDDGVDFSMVMQYGASGMGAVNDVTEINKYITNSLDHTFMPKKYSEDTFAKKLGSENIEITDSTKGWIFNTPIGNRYLVTMDDAGNFVKTLI